MSKLYIEDLIVGEDYSKLKKCISISIPDFNLTEDAKMIQTKNKGVLAALEELKTMNLPRAARDIYEEIMKEKRDKRAREEYVWDEGKAEGITNVKLLIRKLAEAGREDDIIKFATDEAYLKKLLKEFNI